LIHNLLRDDLGGGKWQDDCRSLGHAKEGVLWLSRCLLWQWQPRVELAQGGLLLLHGGGKTLLLGVGLRVVWLWPHWLLLLLLGQKRGVVVVVWLLLLLQWGLLQQGLLLLLVQLWLPWLLLVQWRLQWLVLLQ
jgi:hypothetical protein